MESIEAYFERANRPMTENNKKQALILKGSEVLVNENGMAPGMLYKHEDRIIFFCPDRRMKLNRCSSLKPNQN